MTPPTPTEVEALAQELVDASLFYPSQERAALAACDEGDAK